jgi:hypothetical protein
MADGAKDFKVIGSRNGDESAGHGIAINDDILVTPDE